MAPPPPPDPLVDTHASEVEIPSTTGEAMPALLVHAPAGPPRPAVVIGGDITGARNHFIDGIAHELGRAGFDALVPEFFFREGPLVEPDRAAVFARRAQLDDVRAIGDLGAAIDWVRGRDGAGGAGGAVGVLGFCMGGTFALNLAATREDLVTVAYYGFPGPTPAPAGVQGPYPRDQVGTLRGPLLAFWGDQDDRAGREVIREYAAAAAGEDREVVVYPGLDHGFLSTGWDVGAEGHDAAMDSWDRTLALFEAHLTT
jgi:dienelactone hydrolase